ncbi:MAG: sulfite exporter TauE/SafE family protein [Candidatus Nanopelagicaceae bacterium]
MEIFLAIVCGVAIGSILGFVGAGGSMVAVPMLIYIFGMSPVQATTASLIIVFSGALSGVLSKLKSNEVLIRESLTIWALGLATNFGGAYILPQIADSIVLTGFSLVLIGAGVSMLIKPPSASAEKKMSLPALVALSLLVGALTGLFGIGGGFIAIPILVLFYNVAPAKAAGTSLFIITINTFTGFFAHYRHWDEISWQIPIFIALTAVIVARLASARSSKLKPESLKRAFAYTVFAIAAFTLFETWVINIAA